MKILVSDAPQMEYEALCLLEYFAQGQDANGASAILRKVEKLAVGMSRKQEGQCFDGILELYEESVVGKDGCDPAFRPIEALGTSPARLAWLSETEGTTVLTQLKRALALDVPLNDGEDLIRALSKKELTPEERWTLLTVYSDFAAMKKRVEDQLAAQKLKFRRRGVSAQIKGCVAGILEQIKTVGERAFAQKFGIPGTCAKVEVIPAVMDFDRVCVHSCADGRMVLRYGVVADQLKGFQKQAAGGREALLARIKALSDGSRLLILSQLGKTGLYGQEICELTGLSPATVSHHMGELMKAGLVKAEKKGTKITYDLNEKAAAECLEELSLLMHLKKGGAETQNR